MKHFIPHAIILGKLADNPKPIMEGSHIISFAVNVDTEKRSQTFSVTALGKLGKVCMEYLLKGHSVYVNGELFDDGSIQAESINFISENAKEIPNNFTLNL